MGTVTEVVEVLYGEDRWRLFRRLRSEVAEMMRPMVDSNIEALAYGSVARGDVSKDSDIDIFIPKPPMPTLVEVCLERNGVPVTEREIVQATPSYAAKGYIYVGERRSYSFPLVAMRTVEREFYGFAGSADATKIRLGIRVPGVDKRLMLIEPMESGHVESTVPGREGVVARLLGVSLAAVQDRVRTLRRREKIGRTGVFVVRKLSPEEGFEEVFQQLSMTKPALRRRLRMQ